jgi:ABC-type uncharacterized transport system involved in gliding motility auxiliary subunit
MQTTPRVYRFSGLIAVLGLLALLIGFIVMLLLPSIQYAAWGILVLGILLLATAFIIDFRRVSHALTGRRGRFGAGTTVMASVFIGITLLVNAISIGNYHRFDVTGVAQFTLTSQTKEVLSELETPVQALFFSTPADPYGIANYITNLLTEYQNYTDQLSVEYIDPDEHPDQARQYGIEMYQTIVFESQNRQRLVSPTDIIIPMEQNFAVEAEHAFTSAILEVTGIVQKKVYFITGHGESNINSTASNGFSSAREGLLDNLYKVGTLDLMFTPSIPEDCTALIIAAPQEPLTSSEVEIIERYLESGGWALILINPNSPPDIRQLLSSWGVDIEDGIVIDSSSYVDPSKDIPLVTGQRNFLSLPEIYFPGATAIIPQEEVPDTIIIMEPLVHTSKESWLERDFDPREEPEFNEGIDRKGHLALGVLIAAAPTEGANGEPTEESKVTRLVVIGDSDFASNKHFYNANNGEFFLNSVNLLTAGKELISIERKVVPFRRLIVGPEVARFINYSSIGLLPLLVLVIGGIIWWRRR